MSQENVETVRKAVGALSEGDVEAYLACCTNDVALRSPFLEFEGGREGQEGVQRLFSSLREAAPDYRLDVERIEAVGPEQVIAFLRATASGRASGVPVDSSVVNVYDVADGLIERVRVFRDPQDALEAVGLSE